MLASEDRPTWTRMSFAAAEENFTAGARDGVEATMYWPGYGSVPWDELVLRHLLPLAAEGLARRKVSQDVIDHYLQIIEARCKLRRNGAAWQVETVEALEGRGMNREAALHKMLELYLERMHSNEPVHTWDLPTGSTRRPRPPWLGRGRGVSRAGTAWLRCSGSDELVELMDLHRHLILRDRTAVQAAAQEVRER